MIVKRKGKWYVESHEGKNLGGPYDSKEQAENRMAEVEMFKHNPKDESMLKNMISGFEVITTNLVGMTRHDKMEDRDYLVVPMIMMVEGVLNGSGGALYYPKEELEKVPCVWNHKPIVIYHPTMNGQGVSACDPDVITSRKVGVIMNTKFSNGKLKAEAWLEVERLKKVDERVAENLEKGKMTEVSTGLFTDNVEEEGEYNGKKYKAIARNYRPDHLAILPDLKGACSIEDGAGLLRNELSHDNLRSQLQSKLKDTTTFSGMDSPSSMPWVSDVYDGFFILQDGNKLYKISYSMKDDVVTLGKDKEEVVRVTEYRTKDGKFVGNASQKETVNKEEVKTIQAPLSGPLTNKKEVQMDKKLIVDALIANGSKTEADREELMKMADADFIKLIASPKIVEKTVTVTNTVPAETPKTIEAFIANAPEGMRDMLNAGLAAHKAQKDAVIAVIKQNKANVFTDIQLNAKSLEELKSIAALAAAPAANYSGQAPVDTPAPVATTNAAEEPLVMASMDFSKK